MLLEEMIEAVEADFPDHDWLIRSNREPPAPKWAARVFSAEPHLVEEYQKGFFANITPKTGARGISPAAAYADTALDALHKAYHRMTCHRHGMQPRI